MDRPILEEKNLILLPNFDENRNELHEFLNISTTIFSHYYNRGRRMTSKYYIIPWYLEDKRKK